MSLGGTIAAVWSLPTGVQMGIRSQEPDPGQKTGRAQWVYQPVANGARINAFLAGYPFGVQCHYDGASKPCRSAITGGVLGCKYCGVGHEPEWRGFTPIYTEHYLWRFVLIPPEYLEAVRELPLSSLIRVSRGNRKYDPPLIKPDPWRTLPLPPDAERAKPIDLLPSLLKCWKDPELTKWHMENPNPRASVNAVSLPADVPPAIAERMRPPPVKTADEIDAQLDKVIGHLTHKGEALKRGKVSPNGKHPPPAG